MRRKANYRQGLPTGPLPGTDAPVASGSVPSTPSAATVAPAEQDDTDTDDTDDTDA